MSNYKEPNGQSIEEQHLAALVKDYAAQSTDEKTDLWPAVQSRLLRRPIETSALPQHSDGREAGHALPRPRAQQQSGRCFAGVYSPLRALAVAALIIAVGAATLFAVSGLAHHIGDPLPLTTQAVTPVICHDGGCQRLFSVPISNNSPDQRFGGFAVGDDSSFWIGEAGRAVSPGELPAQPTLNRLFHYSSQGTLLSELVNSTPDGALTDLEVQGSTIYAMYGTKVRTLTLDGKSLQEYYPVLVVPGSVTVGEIGFALEKGDGGQMLVEQVGTGSYWRMQDANPDQPNKVRLDSLPYGNKSIAKTRNPGEIQLGDQTIELDLPGTIIGWNIAGVAQDDSFYVVASASTLRLPDIADGTYTYALHYNSQGTLLQHALLPIGVPSITLMNQVVVDSRQIYAVEFAPDPHSGQSAYNLSVLRVDWSPASQALTLLPTPAPTIAVPTSIPTAIAPVVQPPNPVATNNAIATAAKQPAYAPTITSQPPPTEAPVRDLATLAQSAQAIALVHVESIGEGQISLVFSGQAQSWLKQPSPAPTGMLTVLLPYSAYGSQGEAAMPQSFWDPSVTDYVMFLNPGDKQGQNNPTSYKIAGASAGIFAVRDGQIRDAGISQYTGWSLDNFLQAVRSAIR